MKKTIFDHIEASECEVLRAQRGAHTGSLLAMQIRHPSLPRPRWFRQSQRGNWYTRYTRGATDSFADGVIIRGGVALLEERAASAPAELIS